MNKLPKSARHKKILDILREKGFVEVDELSKLFSLSEMSIRNDLNELDRQGKLRRKYGGANISERNNQELPLTEKQKRNYREKERIGIAAAGLVCDGDSIMIDAGTTTEHVARFLDGKKDLTIITNGINIIVTLLKYSGINVYTVEGKVDGKSYSIVGEQAESALKKYNAKVAFVSADGLSLEFGLTNNSSEANNIANILINNSLNRVLVADSSKIGKVGIFPFCNWKDISVWITDEKVPQDFKNHVESIGVNVIIAE
jgi:DeoR family transcriptional regulator of aga operon